MVSVVRKVHRAQERSCGLRVTLKRTGSVPYHLLSACLSATHAELAAKRDPELHPRASPRGPTDQTFGSCSAG